MSTACVVLLPTSERATAQRSAAVTAGGSKRTGLTSARPDRKALPQLYRLLRRTHTTTAAQHRRTANNTTRIIPEFLWRNNTHPNFRIDKRVCACASVCCVQLNARAACCKPEELAFCVPPRQACQPRLLALPRGIGWTLPPRAARASFSERRPQRVSRQTATGTGLGTASCFKGRKWSLAGCSFWCVVNHGNVRWSAAPPPQLAQQCVVAPARSHSVAGCTAQHLRVRFSD